MPGLPKFAREAKSGATDFFQLSVAYAKQEALEPIVRQAKSMGKGIAGAVLMALGTVMLGLGLVRALQSELGSSRLVPGNYGSAPAPTGLNGRSGAPSLSYLHGGALRYPPEYGTIGHLSGNLSWVPYFAGAVFCLLVAGWCATRITRKA